MEMLSEQNAKNAFLLEMFCQVKHRFAKAPLSQKLHYLVQFLQLVKKTPTKSILICTDTGEMSLATCSHLLVPNPFTKCLIFVQSYQL